MNARERLGRNPSISVSKDGRLKPDAGERRRASLLSPGAKTFLKMKEAAFHELLDRETRINDVPDSALAGTSMGVAVRKGDGKELVIKTKEKKDAFKDRDEELEWVDTMKVQLNMPKVENICQVLDVVETEVRYHVLMERISGQDLFEHYKSEKPTMDEAKGIVKQILEAVKVLHDAGRVHRDLKMENVMVDKKSGEDSPTSEPGSPGSPAGKVKLIDFDTVKNIEDPGSGKRSPKVVGTSGYVAPESYDGIFIPASDVFCVGVILYKLLTGKFPFHQDLMDDFHQDEDLMVGSDAMVRMKERVHCAKINFKRIKDDQAMDLCSKMLQRCPDDRITVDLALAHEWFSDAGSES